LAASQTIKQGPDGYIYVGPTEGNGTFMRILARGKKPRRTCALKRGILKDGLTKLLEGFTNAFKDGYFF